MSDAGAPRPERTYGTLKLLPPTAEHPHGRWELAAQPHVIQLAKRLWRRGGKVTGRVFVDATEANAVDLDWLTMRYPLETLNGDGERLAGAVARSRERIRRVQEYLGQHVPPPSFRLALPPRDYQAREAAILLEQGYLLNADQVGLGKTCAGIAPMADRRALPAVVVCPTHLPEQWKDEIKKFLPGLRCYVIPTGPVRPLPGASGAHQAVLPGLSPDVVICTYSRLAKWAQVLAPYARYVVFDEAQELRRDRSGSELTQKYAAATHLANSPSVRFRYLASATPIYNYGDEIFNVLEVMAPGSLGTRTEFFSEWCTPIGNNKQKITNPPAFGSWARDQGLIVRHTRKEVGRELPDLITVVQEVGAEAKHLEAIEGRAAELARMLVSGVKLEKGEALMAGGELDRLVRQATGLAKSPFVSDFVQLLVESDEKVLLGLWHHSVYDLIEERLKKSDIRCVRFTGQESATQKAASVQDFTRGSANVLMMSLRSGIGLDGLQKACRVTVYGELDWSPEVHLQFSGRLRRDGQADPVLAYYLVADSGSDPTICEVLGVKRQQAAGIVDPNLPAESIFASAGEDRARRLAEEWLRRHET